MTRHCVPIVVLLCAARLAFADTYNEVSGSGLYIDSVPSGAKLFIDGVERGLTPFSAYSMRSGEYNIRIEKEGYSERRFRVVLRRNSRVEVVVDLEEAKGQVLLEIVRDTGDTPASSGAAPGDTTSAGAASPPEYAPSPEYAAALHSNPRVSIDGVRVADPDFTETNRYQEYFSLPVGWSVISVEAFGWERTSARIYVEENSVQKLELRLKPAAFTLTGAALRKKRFNPRDSGILGSAEFGFTVSAPGKGILEILDSKGTIVYSRTLPPFTTWHQQALWNGRNTFGNSVDDGTYTIRISAWHNDEAKKQTTELDVTVDRSIVMRPLTTVSSVSGLLFAPSPEALPAHSYQIEGSFLAGKPPRGEAWKSLPFGIGIRAALLDKLEAAAAFNADPAFSGDTSWGAGVSVKWVFFRPSGGAIKSSARDTSSGFIDALGVAAELSYGWASAGPYTAFGMGTGAGLRIPLMYRIVEGEQAGRAYSFDILASPLVLWAGDNGYPDAGLPRAGAEAGALLSYGIITTGISARWDYDPGSGSSGPIVSALELKFQPSSFSLSVLGGFWHDPDKKNTGAFFGAGMGIMY